MLLLYEGSCRHVIFMWILLIPMQCTLVDCRIRTTVRSDTCPCTIRTRHGFYLFEIVVGLLLLNRGDISILEIH
ncbi:hypothetical protein F4809DRAFT_460688 [Biscogniauxia mediterranea]|nr:hypothetical protein F4809DRAFT_460688 [Biscogniauxia mediterranea]